jgi:ATP-dependent RNA helicase RhlE
MMLFSATIDHRIKKLANSYMEDPMIIEVGPEGRVETIEEEKIHLSRAEKMNRLKDILAQEPYSRVIVFVATKHAVERVCHKLVFDGMDARYIHGGKSQTQRERVMREFKEGDFRILVATDVAARGLHINDISHIISYDEADTHETHTHRIGRTGRMGKGGKAITFVETDPLPKIDYRARRASGGGGNRNRSGYGGGNRSHGHGSRSGGYGGREGGSSYGGYGSARTRDRGEYGERGPRSSDEERRSEGGRDNRSRSHSHHRPDRRRRERY